MSGPGRSPGNPVLATLRCPSAPSSTNARVDSGGAGCGTPAGIKAASACRLSSEPSTPMYSATNHSAWAAARSRIRSGATAYRSASATTTGAPTSGTGATGTALGAAVATGAWPRVAGTMTVLWVGHLHRAVGHERVGERTEHDGSSQGEHPPLTVPALRLESLPGDALVDLVPLGIHRVELMESRLSVQGCRARGTILVNPGNGLLGAIVSPVMAVNPDPKPGRWILLSHSSWALPRIIHPSPLFFVSSLPEGSPTTTLGHRPSTSTTVGPDGGTTVPGTGTTVPGTAEAYIAQLDTINESLQVLATEMVTVNDGFNADPRTVEFDDAVSRFGVVATDTQALADQVAALVVPPGLETNQQALVTAIDFCAGAAQDALDGIQSTDTGELRNTAVTAYTTSATGFDTEVQQARTAAGVTPDA